MEAFRNWVLVPLCLVFCVLNALVVVAHVIDEQYASAATSLGVAVICGVSFFLGYRDALRDD